MFAKLCIGLAGLVVTAAVVCLFLLLLGLPCFILVVGAAVFYTGCILFGPVHS